MQLEGKAFKPRRVIGGAGVATTHQKFGILYFPHYKIQFSIKYEKNDFLLPAKPKKKKLKKLRII